MFVNGGTSGMLATCVIQPIDMIKVEIQVRKIYCVSRAVPLLPFNIEDASRSDAEIDEALKEGKQLAKVNQDTRLNNRVLDLRTPANQAIFFLTRKVTVVWPFYIVVSVSVVGKYWKWMKKNVKRRCHKVLEP